MIVQKPIKHLLPEGNGSSYSHCARQSIQILGTYVVQISVDKSYLNNRNNCQKLNLAKCQQFQYPYNGCGER